ncbi:MAG: hydrolase [Gammaproteobacteria bacterium]|nr:hydrolase [Gammaproteobacteria bacterium]MDE2345035.1 hydrolase [Gammaproteobacteria bacterium]
MIIDSQFTPAPGLSNRHVQTLLPNLVFRIPKIQLRRERIELPDGDYIDADWTMGKFGPIVIVLHGLEGSINSRYAARMMHDIHAMGWRGFLPHFRGCSGEPNRRSIGYHSGFTSDLEYLSETLKKREPGTQLAVVGYSLGGNVILKWLGESPHSGRIVTAVAVSVPFDLADASRVIETGVSQIYKWSLLGRMRRSTLRKFRQVTPPFKLPDIRRIRTFREFDDKLTAPLHGFKDADDYYNKCSSRHYLKNIRIPTLVLHSEDDPFMSPASIPRESELSGSVRLELSRKGGHVGFVGGTFLRPQLWLGPRICRHLHEYLGA